MLPLSPAQRRLVKMPPLNALGGLNGIMSEVLLRVGIQVKLFIKSRGNGAGGGGGGCSSRGGVGRGDIWELPELPPQFSCKPKIALKSSLFF